MNTTLFISVFCGVIMATIGLTLLLQKLTPLTRFLFIIITPILAIFYYELPVLVNLIMDALFILFLVQLYKVEKAPVTWYNLKHGAPESKWHKLSEKIEDDEDFAELTDIEGIDWSGNRM